MDVLVVVSACHVIDLQAAATVVLLPADSQYVGSTATDCRLSSTSISFAYCIFLQCKVSSGYTRLFDTRL